jgi:hypothetical protein
MRLWLFLKAFAICTAGALIYAAVFAGEITLGLLVRLAAADLGVSLLVAMLYPNVRGVKAGDMVLLVSDAGIFSIRTAVALESKRVNEAIRLALPDGREAYAMLESYAGLITPARARVLVEKQQPQIKLI